MEKGILDKRVLPSKDFDNLWQHIILPDEVKNQLKAQILLELTVTNSPKTIVASLPIFKPPLL